MPRLFGTDGLRGVANDDLTVEVVTDLGRAAATVLGRGHARPLFLIGGDTRASTDLLTAALIAGLCSAGADVMVLGVMPTAGVAWSVVVAEAQAGVVVSASHNPAPDNGVKFFGPAGYKLPDAIEDEIQACFEAKAWSRPTGAAVGRVRPAGGLETGYFEHLLAASRKPLDALRVVLDTANGSGFLLAPDALRACGADVTVIHAQPDGLNINDGCGATHVDGLAAEVLARQADLGLALDGDADRLIAVDAAGAVVDGDQILAVVALDRDSRAALKGDAVVVTVMTNLGFHDAMRTAGIGIHVSQVGDRYVLEALRREGLELGGEQSGHTFFLDLSTTGDGILTAIQLCGSVVEGGRSLAELASVVERYPQVLRNVRVANKRSTVEAAEVLAAVRAAEQRLGEHGRVLLRPSGTENLVRVMVEAPDEVTAATLADELAAIVATVS